MSTIDEQPGRRLTARGYVYPCQRCGRVFDHERSRNGHLSHCGKEKPAGAAGNVRPVTVRRGTVYILVTTEGPSRFKIGFTQGDLERRVHQIQGHSPLNLEVHAAWKALTRDEWDAQQFVKHAHCHREWFSGEEALKDVLDLLDQKGERIEP